MAHPALPHCCHLSGCAFPVLCGNAHTRRGVAQTLLRLGGGRVAHGHGPKHASGRSGSRRSHRALGVPLFAQRGDECRSVGARGDRTPRGGAAGRACGVGRADIKAAGANSLHRWWCWKQPSALLWR